MAKVLVDRPLKLVVRLAGSDLHTIALSVADNGAQLETLVPLAAKATHLSIPLPSVILLAQASENLHQSREHR